jgi:hypothetical protein
VCNATLCAEEVKITALECLVHIAELYYGLMADYMAQALYPVGQK